MLDDPADQGQGYCRFPNLIRQENRPCWMTPMREEKRAREFILLPGQYVPCPPFPVSDSTGQVYPPGHQSGGQQG